MVLGALKKAEVEDVLIVRFVETIGQAVTATIQVDGVIMSHVDFKPFEIKSFKLKRQDSNAILTPCNLLEE